MVLEDQGNKSMSILKHYIYLQLLDNSRKKHNRALTLIDPQRCPLVCLLFHIFTDCLNMLRLSKKRGTMLLTLLFFYNTAIVKQSKYI